MKPILTLFLGLALILPCTASFSSDSSPDVVIYEDFQSYSKGEVPDDGWRTRNGSSKGIYSIAQDGEDLYLKAHDIGQSVQLFREKGWDPKSYPVLSWKWRVRDFPKGSDERKGETNDSAAAIYVVFPNRFFVPEAIKYVWSEKVPVETKIARSHRFPTIVIRSGADKKGEWAIEHRDVVRDFVKHFGRRPAGVNALGFLTDANAVKGSAKADYDDFVLMKTLPKPKPTQNKKAESEKDQSKKTD